MNNSRPKLKKTEKKIEYDNRPVRYRCDYSSTPLKVLQARGWTRISDAKDPGWDLWWCDTSELKLALDGRLRPQQKVAHFRNHCELTRKNYLYRNLRRYRRMLVKAGKVREAELCDAMPTTYELPNEYRMFVEEHRKRPGCTWIVKPAGGSQGRGIFLFQRLKDIANLRLNPYPGHHDLYDDEVAPSPLETHLVQKYIDDPYLLEGRKFDLRIYVLVTSFQPLKVWLAREGFARLSGKKFSLQRIKDSQVHLTNVSIQLKASKADREDDEDTHELNLGGKWPLHNLRQYLTARHGAQVVDELLQNIAGIIMASLQAVQYVIINGKNSFELYGYDIILDERLKPWLLEVNASPSLNATDSRDFRLKFDLIDDVLNILDFERLLTGRETRVGGFDLLWDDAPIWSDEEIQPPRLNIFLGAPNDRIEQLKNLRRRFTQKEKDEKTESYKN